MSIPQFMEFFKNLVAGAGLKEAMLSRVYTVS